MVCGDDDQSIYGWRGADINNILDFEKDYTTPLRWSSWKRITASTQTILDCANSVIARNTGRKERRYGPTMMAMKK